MAWTVVGVLSTAVFAALGLLATALFQLRQDISRLGTELHAEFRTEFAALRAEVAALLSDIRADIRHP
jgi:hypothetical protein